MATVRGEAAIFVLVVACVVPVTCLRHHTVLDRLPAHYNGRLEVSKRFPRKSNSAVTSKLATDAYNTMSNVNMGVHGVRTDPGAFSRALPQTLTRNAHALIEQRLGMQGWSMTSPRGSLRIVAVCHRHWHGIKAATEAFGFPLVLRDDQSSTSWDAMFLAALRHVDVKKVLINGIPSGTADLAAALHADGRQVYLTYHGSFVQHVGYSYSVAESDAFASALSSLTQGHITRLGLLKIEMIGVMKSMGINAFPLNNLVDRDYAWTVAPKFGSFDGKLHIGILGSGSLGKNVITQLAAACTLPDVVVHVLKLEHEASYLKLCKSEIVRHEAMDHATFRRLLAQMDVNLYASLHECQPMVALESIAAGVPCIISDTSTIYSYDAKLEKQLVCKQPDSADAIHACIQSTLHMLAHTNFKDTIKSYIDIYNKKACSLLENFLQEKASNLPSTFQRVCQDTLQVSNNNRLEHFAQLPGDVEIGAGVANDVHIATVHNESLPTECQRTSFRGEMSNYRLNAPANGSIVLTTYELDGVTPGGAGVLISALAGQLAASGCDVIVLADMPPLECHQWAAVQASRNADLAARLRVVSVYDLGISYHSQGNEFVAKSILWAHAVEAVAAKYNVAAVEFFEYAGPAAALLSRRMQGRSSLPDSLAVYVRAHGSLEMIDAAEGVDPTTDRLQMYAMERFAMATADVVIYPSASMRALYERSVGALAQRSIVGTPPVRAIVAAVTNRPSRWKRGVKELQCRPDSRMFNFLVLGKIQKIKNSALIARAAVQFLDAKAGRHATVTFVGTSFRNIDTQTDPLTEVRNIVPPHLRNRVIFCPKAGRNELSALLSLYNAAIVASAFESFNIAAHEMHAAGLPLVISDFDAFADFFHGGNAFIFKRGNSSDLAAAMLRAMTTKFKHPRMQYVDAVDTYSCLRGLDVTLGRSTARSSETLHNHLRGLF